MGRSADKLAVEAVLERARWAPSGDNTQPWRFEIVDKAHAVIHGSDTRDHCVYDIDGRPSQISIGCLIETAAIAASTLGLRLHTSLRPGLPETRPTVDLRFEPDSDLPPDPLAAVIERRSVQRRPYATTALRLDQKAALETAVGPGIRVRWLEGPAARRAAAALMFRSARLRLITPEAFRVHRDVIEWGARFSAERVPDQALGVSAAMLGMMKFAMHSWPRVQFFNRFLAGTWLPRLQMDLWPALACGGHFVLLSERPASDVSDHLQAGRAVQRFWLTATRLDLQLQPELTPLIFARYARQGRTFSIRPTALDEAREVAERLALAFGPDVVTHGIFMGRIGHAPAATARSLRRELAQLLAR